MFEFSTSLQPDCSRTNSTASKFWEWEGACLVCNKSKKDLKGVFCANFAHARGIWSPCRSVWYGACYRADRHMAFHINSPEEDEGIVWKRRKSTQKFLTTRSGDSFFTPFQCDFCMFKNIKKRAHMSSSQADMRLLSYIRRANLDAF